MYNLHLCWSLIQSTSIRPKNLRHALVVYPEVCEALAQQRIPPSSRHRALRRKSRTRSKHDPMGPERLDGRRDLNQRTLRTNSRYILTTLSSSSSFQSGKTGGKALITTLELKLNSPSLPEYDAYPSLCRSGPDWSCSGGGRRPETSTVGFEAESRALIALWATSQSGVGRIRSTVPRLAPSSESDAKSWGRTWPRTVLWKGCGVSAVAAMAGSATGLLSIAMVMLPVTAGSSLWRKMPKLCASVMKEGLLVGCGAAEVSAGGDGEHTLLCLTCKEALWERWWSFWWHCGREGGCEMVRWMRGEM